MNYNMNKYHHHYPPQLGYFKVTIQLGTVVAGLRKGKFRACVGAEEVNMDKEVMFTLESSATNVYFDGALCTVGALMKERCKTHPDSKVNYHEQEEVPGQPLAVTLKRVMFLVVYCGVV